MDKRLLQRRNIDKKISTLSIGKEIIPKGKSWIRTIRSALGMTSTQLAKKLHISQPRISILEQNETNLKIATLEKVAEALNCEFIYYFKPKTSLEQTVENQAMKKAEKILKEVNLNMSLENQEILTNETIIDLKEDLIRNNLKIIWE